MGQLSMEVKCFRIRREKTFLLSGPYELRLLPPFSSFISAQLRLYCSLSTFNRCRYQAHRMSVNKEETDVFSDLLLAMLAVNSWELDKVGALLPRLKETRLTEPASVARMSFEKVFTSLVEAGYGRGDYIVSLLAERVISAGNAFTEDKLEEKVLEAERSKDIESIKRFLQPIKGVGPKVLETFILLRGLK